MIVDRIQLFPFVARYGVERVDLGLHAPERWPQNNGAGSRALAQSARSAREMTFDPKIQMESSENMAAHVTRPRPFCATR